MLLFGGSFDPPHIGHTELGEHARRALHDRAVLALVPAARSPFKADGPTADGRTRTALLELAFADNPHARVWTEELARAQAAPDAPSYFIDTIRAARAQLGDQVPLWFLIGSDQAFALDRWRHAGEIVALATPLVLARGEDRGTTRQRLQRPPLAVLFGQEPRIVEAPLIEVSSTRVRDALARREPPPGLGHEVERYILARGLYIPPPSETPG